PPMLPVPCSVQEAPVWLLTVAPLLRSNGPATVAAPKLFSVRLKRLGDAVNGDAALAGTDRPPLRLVTPGRPMVGLPPMVPPDHVGARVRGLGEGRVNPPAMNVSEANVAEPLPLTVSKKIASPPLVMPMVVLPMKTGPDSVKPPRTFTLPPSKRR